MNANAQYKLLLKTVLNNGMERSPRGLLTRELMAFQSLVCMSRPVVTLEGRAVSDKFRFGEAAWILSGDNKVSTIAPFNKVIPRFSDDGIRYFGAYGPKVIDQISYVVDCLKKDPDTRQAVMNIWRENPRATKDVPCTLSLQFLQRDGQLHCVATMRSSDAWLGWPYDVFNFSCVARAVAIHLKQSDGPDLRQGVLFLTAGSQHLYQEHFEKAKGVIKDDDIAPSERHRGFSFYEFPSDSVESFTAALWDQASKYR